MAEIKYMIFDIDGTMTDGKLYIGSQGEVFKAFSVKDGYAIHDMLPQLGITPVVITARNSEIVTIRCRELDIRQCYQGIRNKKEKLMALADSWGLALGENGKFAEIAYIGDDIPDLSCMELCSFTACPKDAVDEVKNKVTYISKKNAGEGAVRDIVEWYRGEKSIENGKGITGDSGK